METTDNCEKCEGLCQQITGAEADYPYKGFDSNIILLKCNDCGHEFEPASLMDYKQEVEEMANNMKNIFKWFRYLKIRRWYRRHPLGIGLFITNRRGRTEYCYKCGNLANYVITKYRVFKVPICRPHLEKSKLK